MGDRLFSDTALVLLGHGSTLHDGAAAPVFQHAAELRRRGLFAEVRAAFWKQEPRILDVLNGLAQRRVAVCPLFMSEGYFAEERIPRALGLRTEGETGFRRWRRTGGQTLHYCGPVGTHPAMTSVVLDRARKVVESFPFPRAPLPRDLTLILAGHGTGESARSRVAVERQVECIRAQGPYGAVAAVFLEEAPGIEDAYRLAPTRSLVVVPFFISDGMHVLEDIPVRLGQPTATVRERLAAGQPAWRNPTETHGKLVWCSSSVGTDPSLAGVILERVREALAGGVVRSERERRERRE